MLNYNLEGLIYLAPLATIYFMSVKGFWICCYRQWKTNVSEIKSIQIK
jgi:hypothetical protein